MDDADAEESVLTKRRESSTSLNSDAKKKKAKHPLWENVKDKGE
jgi:hypothetical protein